MNTIELEEQFPLDLTTAEDRTFQKLHLSQIYTDLFNKTFGPPKNTENPLWAQTGFLWERVLAAAFAEKYDYIIRPGEVECDGIVCSPDCIDLKHDYLEEYKCTWLSTKTKPWDVWKWMAQTKGYCRVLGLKDVKFRVWYVNGSYGKGKPFGPDYKAFIINFTQMDLDLNWLMLTNHAKKMGWLV